jgi:hypothetical protein
MYSDAGRKIVSERYALEIEMLGYAFPGESTAGREQ